MYSRTTTYHVPSKKKGEKKKERERENAAFQKRKKFARPDGGRPRLVPLNFRSSTERQRVDRVCFSSLRGWADAGEHAPRGKNLEARRFFEPSTRTFSRAVHRKPVQTQPVRLLGSKGKYETGVWSTKNAAIEVKIISLRGRGNFVSFGGDGF